MPKWFRRVTAKYVIRGVWNLAKHWQPLETYGLTEERKLGFIFNILSLVTTALGGNFSWMPDDVIDEFREMVACEND